MRTFEMEAFQDWLEEHGFRISPEGFEFAMDYAEQYGLDRVVHAGMEEYLDQFRRMFG